MLAVLVAAALSSHPDTLPPHEPRRVGRVIIEGNFVTRDSVILEEFPFRPGQIQPSEAELLKVEIRLLVRFHRRFDLDAGDRPSISTEPNDFGSPYRDVFIHFPEKAPKKKLKR